MRLYRLPRQTGFDDLTLAEAETPRCGRGQVLVRMHAASLNFRDLSVATGRYMRGAMPANLVPLSDGAGEVVETGEGVTRVKPGDRVAGIFMQAGWAATWKPPPFRHSPRRRDRRAYLREYVVFDEQGLVLIPTASPTSRRRRSPVPPSPPGMRFTACIRSSRARPFWSSAPAAFPSSACNSP